MTQVGPLLCLHFKHPVTWMLPHRYGKVGMKYHLNISFEEPPTCLPKKNHKNLHRPGIEPGPPAWQASILPLNQRCYLVRPSREHRNANFSSSAQNIAKKKIDSHFLEPTNSRVAIFLVLDGMFVIKSLSLE